MKKKTRRNTYRSNMNMERFYYDDGGGNRASHHGKVRNPFANSKKSPIKNNTDNNKTGNMNYPNTNCKQSLSENTSSFENTTVTTEPEISNRDSDNSDDENMYAIATNRRRNKETSKINAPFDRRYSKLKKVENYLMKKKKGKLVRQKIKNKNKQVPEIISLESSDDDDVVEIKLPPPPVVVIHSSGESEGDDSEDNHENELNFQKVLDSNNSHESESRCLSPSSNISDDFIGNDDRSRLIEDDENVVEQEEFFHLEGNAKSTTESTKSKSKTLDGDVFVQPQKKAKSRSAVDYQVTQQNFRALDVYESESSDMPENVYAKSREKGPGLKSSSSDVEDLNDIEGMQQKTKKLRKRRASSNRGSEVNEDSSTDCEDDENEDTRNALPFISRGEALHNSKLRSKSKKSSICHDKKTSDDDFVNIIKNMALGSNLEDDGNETDVSNKSEEEENNITAKTIVEDVINKYSSNNDKESEQSEMVEHSNSNSSQSERFQSNRSLVAVPEISENLNQMFNMIDKMNTADEYYDEDYDEREFEDEFCENEVEEEEEEREKDEEDFDSYDRNDDDDMLKIISVTSLTSNAANKENILKVVFSNEKKHLGWNEEMVRFYERSWGDERFSIPNIRRLMDVKANWKIHNSDRLPKNKHFSNIKCYNCCDYGHRQAQCPLRKKDIVCYVCGEKGHREPRCPNTICLRCGNKTLVFMKRCSACKSQDSLTCPICKIRGHSIEYCPDKWRRYHSTTIPNEIPNKNVIYRRKKYCCICAGRGHLAEDCRNAVRFSQYPAISTEIKSHSKSYQDISMLNSIGPNVIAYNLFYEPNERINFEFTTRTNLTSKNYYWRFLKAVGLIHILNRKRTIENEKKNDSIDLKKRKLNTNENCCSNVDEEVNEASGDLYMKEKNFMMNLSKKNDLNKSKMCLQSPLLRKVLKKNFEIQTKIIKNDIVNKNSNNKKMINNKIEETNLVQNIEWIQQNVEELQQNVEEIQQNADDSGITLDIDIDDKKQENEQNTEEFVEDNKNNIEEGSQEIDDSFEEETGKSMEYIQIEEEEEKGNENHEENEEEQNEEGPLEHSYLNTLQGNTSVDDLNKTTEENFQNIETIILNSSDDEDNDLRNKESAIVIKTEKQFEDDVSDNSGFNNDSNNGEEDEGTTDESEDDEVDEDCMSDKSDGNDSNNENNGSKTNEPPSDFLMNVLVTEKNQSQEVSQTPDFIPLSSSIEDDDIDFLMNDEPIGISHRLSGRTFEGECTNFIPHPEMPGAAKIYLTNFHTKYLLSATGQKFLLDKYKKHNVMAKVCLTKNGNYLVMDGFPNDRAKFHTDLLLAFRNISDSPTFDSVKCARIPRKRLSAIKFIQQEILLLQKNLGNVVVIYNRFAHESGSNKKSKKSVKRGRRLLNMILLGRLGLGDGQKHLLGLTNQLKILQDNDYYRVPDDIHKQIHYHWKYIFSSHLHADTHKWFKEYMRMKKQNNLRQFNLMKILGKNAIYVNFTKQDIISPQDTKTIVRTSSVNTNDNGIENIRKKRTKLFNPYCLYRGLIPGVNQIIDDDIGNRNSTNSNQNTTDVNRDSNQKKTNIETEMNLNSTEVIIENNATTSAHIENNATTSTHTENSVGSSQREQKEFSNNAQTLKPPPPPSMTLPPLSEPNLEANIIKNRSSTFVSNKLTEVKKVWGKQCENLLSKIDMGNLSSPSGRSNINRQNFEKSVFWSRECMKYIDLCIELGNIINQRMKDKLHKIGEKAKKGELSYNDCMMMTKVYNTIKAKAI